MPESTIAIGTPLPVPYFHEAGAWIWRRPHCLGKSGSLGLPAAGWPPVS